MNYIQTLAATGLKTADFRHDLDRVTVFTGPARSGKSSRLDAIRLGLIGHVPELGKQAASTMLLARNGHIDIDLGLSNGTHIERRLGKKKKPGEPVVPAVLMDSNEYFSLSDAKKVQYVFSLYRMEEHPDFSGAAITAAIQNIRLEQNTADSEELRKKLVAEMDEADTMRHDIGQPIQEWLGEWIGNLKERLSEANATAKRMTQTVQGITQISAGEMPRNFAQEIAAKRLEIERLQKAIGSLETSLETFETMAGRREALEKELPPEVSLDVAAAVLALQREIEELSAPEAEPASDAAAQIEQLRREIADYQSTPRLADALHAARVAQMDATREETRLIMESHNRNREYAAKMERPCCPECGTETKAFMGRLAAEHNKWLDENREARAKAEQTVKDCATTYQIAEAQLGASKDKDREIEAKRTTLDRLMAEQSKALARRQKAQQERERAIQEKRQAIRRLEDQSAQAERQNIERADKLAKIGVLKGELSRFDVAGIRQSKADREADQRRIAEEIRGLERQQQDWLKAKADEQRNAQALIECRKAEAEALFLKAAVKQLEEIQSRMVEHAFGDILSTVNHITGSLFPPLTVEYREGVMGRWAGATFVTHETFSGTEKALTYAGLSLALAKESPIRLVMIDELGRMDPETLRVFLGRMVKLTKGGEIDQFIGAYSGRFSNDGVMTIEV